MVNDYSNNKIAVCLFYSIYEFVSQCEACNITIVMCGFIIFFFFCELIILYLSINFFIAIHQHINKDIT